MKVLLTGALGNVGLSTLEALLEEGHDVVAFDLESPKTRKLASRLDGRVRVVWGDITDPVSIRAALSGVDAVVHLAAILFSVVSCRLVDRQKSAGRCDPRNHTNKH